MSRDAAPRFARRIHDFVVESRRQRDDEQWHLLVVEEQIRKRGLKQGWLRHRFLPQIMASFLYHPSWLLYAIEPSISYRLNSELEDHAERACMRFGLEPRRLPRPLKARAER